MLIRAAITALLHAAALTAAAQMVAPPSRLAKLPDYRSATEGLRDGLPEVALRRAEKLMSSPEVRENPELAAAARVFLAECQLRAGQPEAVLATTADPAAAGMPDGRFWRALALARLGRPAEAQELLADLCADPAYPRQTEAVFTRAGALAALADNARALELLRPWQTAAREETAMRARLWSSEFHLQLRQWDAALQTLGTAAKAPARFANFVRYQEARALLGKGELAEAGKAFRALMAGARSVSRGLQHAASLGLVRVLDAEKKPAEALAVLETLIGGSPMPDAAVLEAAFLDFERLNVPPSREAAGPSPEAAGFLKNWRASEDPAMRWRATLAAAAAEDAAGNPAAALKICQELAALEGPAQLKATALVRAAALLARQGSNAEAIPLLQQASTLSPEPELRLLALWLQGKSEFETSRWGPASESFAATVRQATDPATRTAAAFNAALAGMRARSADSAALALLEGAQPPVLAHFEVERGLYLASQGAPSATELLQPAADATPPHPRRLDALLALADLAITADPPRHDEAAARLKAAAEAAASPLDRERTGLVALRLEEAAGRLDAFAAAAEKWLTDFPASPHRAALRMRLGEMWFRRQDMAKARKQFETIATEQPGSPLVEAANFWTGRAALLSLGTTGPQEARAAWEKVWANGGPLRFEARMQQIQLSRDSGSTADALQLLKELLEAKPAPDDLTRWRALCIQGEIIARQPEPAERQKALASFETVITSGTAAWKRQARTRMGSVMLQWGQDTAAMDTWHKALEDLPGAGAADEECHWTYTAGMRLVALLQKQARHEDALRVVLKLSNLPAPRGQQAAKMASSIALENHIYTEDMNREGAR